MSIVQESDFATGEIKISTNKFKEEDLQAVIDRVELDTLRRLFGKELYDLFVIDLALVVIGDPTDPRFVEVYNEFYKDEGCKLLESEGIKKMLMRFIWCDYVRDQPYQNAVVGMTKNEQENSSIATGSQYGWYQMYNKAVHSYCSIQAFMVEETATYPEFNGVAKTPASMI